MIKNQTTKNILSAVAVAGFGFVLLNLAFIIDFLFQSAILAFFRLFIIPDDSLNSIGWIPPTIHFTFVLLVGVVSWFVFRSKLRVLFKAIFMTVPTAVVLVTIGMSLYRWPIASYSVGVAATGIVLYWFHRTKQPWLYSYAVILVSFTLFFFTLSGGEI
jgi:hypothetical protein